MNQLWRAFHVCFVALIAFGLIVQTTPSLLAAEKSQPERRDQYLSLKAKLAPLGRIFKYISSQVDRSVFEVPALARKLGPDPKDAFEFVRDQIGYRAYYGSLRGPDGVLVDRVGNALDRALLLAAILAANKHQVRIAQALLDDNEAENLAIRTFEPQPETPPVVELTPELLSVFLNEGKMSSDDVRNVIAKQEKQAKSFSAELAEIVEPAFSELQTAIENSDLKLPEPPGMAQLSKEASEHYWVQLKTAGGEWINLDPSLPGSLIGEARLKPALTFSPSDIPEDLQHRVQIQVVLSVNEQGRIVEKTALDEMLKASEHVGKSISLASAPLDQKKSLLTQNSAQRVAYSKQETMAVALQVEGKTIAAQLFNLDGELLKKPPEVADRVKSGFGKTFSALNQMSAPTQQGAKSSDNQLIGMRVLYTQIDSQGLDQKPKHRPSERVYLSGTEVINWTPDNGAVTRPANLSPIRISSSVTWMTEISVLPAAVSANYIAYKQFSFLGPSWKYLDIAMREAFGIISQANSTITAGLLPWQLYSVAAAAANTSKLFHNAAEQPQEKKVSRYNYRTTLLALETQVADSEEEPSPHRQITDIVNLGDRTAVENVQVATVARWFNLELGVKWTALERLIAEQNVIGRNQMVRPSKTLTRTLASARANSIRLSVVAPGNPIGIDQLAIPAKLKNELANSGQQSSGLAIPSWPVSKNEADFGWWALDRDTGIPIGRLPGGRGAVEEYKVNLAMGMNILLSVHRGYICFTSSAAEKAIDRQEYSHNLLCMLGIATGLLGSVGLIASATKGAATAAAATAVAGHVIFTVIAPEK